LGFIKPGDIPECMEDHISQLVSPVNSFLHDNLAWRSVLLIMSSGILDFLSILTIYRFICFHKDCRLLTTIGIFMVCRGLLQNFFTLTIPEDSLWDFPGFYSIMVPYFHTNDFFHRGHIGNCFIFYLEARRDGITWLKWVAFGSIFFEWFALLVTRGHYTIDLVAGLVFAHYVYMMVDEVYEARERERRQTGEPDLVTQAINKVVDEKDVEKGGEDNHTHFDSQPGTHRNLGDFDSQPGTQRNLGDFTSQCNYVKISELS